MAATITWRGGNGHWAQQAQWLPLQLPGAGQDVLLGSGSYTVTLDSAGAALDVSVGAGVTFDVSGQLDLGGVLSLAPGAALHLEGLIAGGTLALGSGSVAVSGGTLEGVAVPGGFAALAGVTIDAATAAASVPSGGTIVAAGQMTLLGGTYDAVTFLLDQTGGGSTLLAAADAAQVTLGAQAVVSLYQDPASVFYPMDSTVAGLTGAGSFTNLGTILSNTATGALHPLRIDAAGFDNQGQITVLPLQVAETADAVIGYQQGPHGLKLPVYGTLAWTTAFAPLLDIASDSFSNSGTLALAGGRLGFSGGAVNNTGVITLIDTSTQSITVDPSGVSSITSGILTTEIDIGAGVASFLNTGTITADRIVLGGSVHLAALGTLHGALDITGTLDLDGGTLDAGLFGGVAISGVLANGTLLPGGGGVLLDGATLDNVTALPGALSYAAPVTLLDPPGGSAVTLDAHTTTLRLSGGATNLAIMAGDTGVLDRIALPDGGSETFGTGTTLSATVAGSTVEIGGAQSTLVNTGVFTVDAAAQHIAATLDGNGTIHLADGGALTLDALAATATPTIDFGDGVTLLVLPGTGALNVALTGLKPGDAIDFTSVSSTPSGPFGIGGAAAADGTLFVTGAGGDSVNLPLTPGANGLYFHVVPDSFGGSLVEVACFAAGTHIATPGGPAPVQSLRPGDAVQLADGAVAPVRWVGCTTIDLARHPDPARAAPVRISADAIAPGVPCRDLLLSPEHCLFLDGVLIPAGRLVNGASIQRDDSFGRIEYWHVELDRHGILLAEGVAAESYLDTGNRALFAGEAGVRALHPDLAANPDADALAVWAQHGAAPLQLHPHETRAVLAARAEHLGWQRSADCGLGLTCARGTLAADATAQGWRVVLPAGVDSVWLHSRSFVPAEAGWVSGDTRRLGVALRSARLAGWPLHPDACAEGWHARRGGEDWRWSDGAARLTFPRLAKPTVLELDLAGGGEYWLPPASHMASAARHG